MDLASELATALGADRVLARPIDRIAFANDASVYRLVPQVVVLPRSVDDVRALLAVCRRRRVPLTFRAAGTSLSGQAVTDGVLAVVSRHWRSVRVEQDGRLVRVQPGVIGGDVNRRLAPLGRKIGPDPASIDSCMMGGILANNSSGMCCGVIQNAYHTLRSMTFVLADGLLVDTAEPEASARLRRESPSLVEGLLEIRNSVEANPALRERIRTKYRMKNTTGYSLNALLDFPDPVELLAHLMIGSEGTLGFIAEAVLETVPDYPVKYTGLLFFADVARACAAIAPLRDSGARALELMDRASLRSVEDQPGVPPEIRDLPPAAAALLVEYQCEHEDELRERIAGCERLLPSLPLLGAPGFTRDRAEQAALWRIRKGLIPTVGAMRRRGTSFIIEDVVFPVERLAAGVTDLQALFTAHGYDDAILFGHAKDGNLHFVLTQAFERPDDVARYDAFMHELAGLVAGRHGGALKAEHGTGRNMAPFVATEWGDDALEVMRALKRLVDPDGVLNPGVILNPDPRAHVTHLKPLPAVEQEVDRCIECGFCERMCPSRDLTLTPRQRIVVRREMARLRAAEPGSTVLASLEADYVYDALDTCATDGLCATACPVGIDTGRLVKRLRGEGHSRGARAVAAMLADRFGWVERGVRLSLRAGHAVRAVTGQAVMVGVTGGLRRVLGKGVPRWSDDLPGVAPKIRAPAGTDLDATVLYFPSCVTRVIAAGDEGGSSTLADVLLRVSERAGVRLRLPPDARGYCCGMPFSSKGYREAYRRLVERTVDALWTWSEQGRLPVVVDSSPCAYTLREAGHDLSARGRDRFEALRILDGIELAHDELLPRLSPRRIAGEVALHPVCSVRKMDLSGKLLRLAGACAERATIPLAAGCCGFAGDRGFTLPELTDAATRAEAAELAGRPFHGYYSSSRTCEIGLTRATGKPYRSFWHLLDEATR